uniref:3-oxo-5-alpha-steroid 4-dehydrogenase C-terminal domain-containing protein n=1 Tax=Periophthalmus magnuspinnatus TaxID=409849 RepID=A0A3B4AMW3_9GOBI
MECAHSLVHRLSALLLLGGVLIFLRQLRRGPVRYGRYACSKYTIPARWAWFLQELPAFLVPVLLACTTDGSTHGRRLLLCTFTLHYFHRAIVYPLLIRGRPIPAFIVVSSELFCFFNGILQSHTLLHCSFWFSQGLCLFALGMILNIHSDHILRNLRRSGETVYKIPRGGLFELVSGANFLAEILEWFGFAVVVWNLPGFSFFFFTVCSIGPRAIGHHRYCTVSIASENRTII